MVNKQIEALLRKDILYIKDVFIPEVSKKTLEKPAAAGYYEKVTDMIHNN